MLLYNCRKEKVIKMRQGLHSQWDERLLIGAKNTGQVFQMYKLVSEIENLDKAHKRAKRELRKQQKALELRKNDLKAYHNWLDKVYKELSKTEQKYKHMLKACDAYFEENQKLKEENQELNAEVRALKHMLDRLEENK